MDPLELTRKELRALDGFRSTDVTRPHLARVWYFRSDGGISHVATDGHGIVVRRAGTHREATLHMIAALPYSAEGFDAATAPAHDRPPPWADVVQAPAIEGKTAAPYHAINLQLLERVTRVEDSAIDRQLYDLAPKPRESAKAFAARRNEIRGYSGLVWTLPADDVQGWFYQLDTPAARWEGVIMPRRLPRGLGK